MGLWFLSKAGIEKHDAAEDIDILLRSTNMPPIWQGYLKGLLVAIVGAVIDGGGTLLVGGKFDWRHALAIGGTAGWLYLQHSPLPPAPWAGVDRRGGPSVPEDKKVG